MKFIKYNIVKRRRFTFSMVAVTVILAALLFYILRLPTTMSMTTQATGISNTRTITDPAMKLAFAKLSSTHTDVCRDLGNKPAIEDYINSLPSGSRLQGSCCTPMDFNRYVSQVSDLKKYILVSQIPPNPYDISKASAQQMLGYYDNIQLSPAQQSIYSQAQSMTNDKGWCCCQCWAWYTHAGLAKYLITHDNYSAQQIVAVINLEDCCGGK